MTNLTSAQRTLNLLAIQKPAVTARMIRQVADTDAVVVLDLEDSLWDVADPTRTVQLKAGARLELLELSSAYADLFKQVRIGVRINRSTSPEFSADLLTLREMTHTGPLSVIVPTKVESAAELERCKQEFDSSGVKYEAIVPIVETVEGMVHLAEIATAAVRLGVPAIIYGHYDYSLYAGLWPIPEHDEEGFWDLVRPFVQQVESAGLNYIHPPVFQIYDGALFKGVFRKLAEMCQLPFGMLAIGGRQAHLCADLVSGKAQAGRLNLRASENLSTVELVNQAMAVQRVYESHRKEGKGFAVDPRTGRFIAPHQYAAALTFLGKVNA